MKVVYSNADGKGNPFDTTETETGTTGLQTALSRLNKNFVGTVGAIFENGGATVIVINCTANDDGYDPGGEQVEIGDYYVMNPENDLAIEGVIAHRSADSTETSMRNAVRAWVAEKEDLDVSEVKVSQSGKVYTFEANGSNYTWNNTRAWGGGVRAKMDGTDILMLPSDTFEDTKQYLDGLQANMGSSVQVTYPNDATHSGMKNYNAALNADESDLAKLEGAVITTGYYEVTSWAGTRSGWTVKTESGNTLDTSAIHYIRNSDKITVKLATPTVTATRYATLNATNQSGAALSNTVSFTPSAAGTNVTLTVSGLTGTSAVTVFVDVNSTNVP